MTSLVAGQTAVYCLLGVSGIKNDRESPTNSDAGAFHLPPGSNDPQSRVDMKQGEELVLRFAVMCITCIELFQDACSQIRDFNAALAQPWHAASFAV
jgi:hypothetical protein